MIADRPATADLNAPGVPGDMSDQTRIIRIHGRAGFPSQGKEARSTLAARSTHGPGKPPCRNIGLLAVRLEKQAFPATRCRQER